MSCLIRVPEGKELLTFLKQYSIKNNIETALITGIGGFRKCTIAYFDFTKRKYLQRKLDIQLEVVALIGNITLLEGKPTPHIHVTLGDREFRAYAGHLINAEVHPFIELGIVPLAELVRKVFDEKKSLYIIE